jgi:hypothetical protein
MYGCAIITNQPDEADVVMTSALQFQQRTTCSALRTTAVNGQPGGLVSADMFLQTWVPRIIASPAYKRDGLLVMAFDEGGLSVVRNPSGGFLINARYIPDWHRTGGWSWLVAKCISTGSTPDRKSLRRYAQVSARKRVSATP